MVKILVAAFLALTPFWSGNIIPEASLLTTRGKVHRYRHSRIFGHFNFLTMRGLDADSQFAATQQGACNGSRSGRSAHAAGPAAPEIDRLARAIVELAVAVQGIERTLERLR
jgi:hypothetical protein